jgi:class 3 adenylate cyclase
MANIPASTDQSRAQPAIDAAEQCLGQGEPLLAYNTVQEGLRVWPENLRLRQLKGLAVARSGDIERANQLLRELAAEGAADAETLGMLARTHKDLGLKTDDAARREFHLAEAFRIYHEAYEAACRAGAGADSRYTGINAAAIAVLQGDLATARRIAGAVRDSARVALPEPSAAANYWVQATLGEAALILGFGAESAAHYAHAASLAAGRFGDLASTRRQAQLLVQRLAQPAAWIAEVLRIPPIVMYTGHMIDHRSRRVPRFPIAQEGAVAAQIRQRLATLRPMASYGSAACGSDLLCLEAMREIGGETHIVLPFPIEEFHRISVDFAPGDWSARFERAIGAADSVTITSDHRARGSIAPFQYANFVLSGMARLRARVLQTELHGLAIWDGKATTVGAGAASLVQVWQSQNLQIEQVHLPQPQADALRSTANCEAPALEEQPPAGFAHEIRAMLFADAVGYSALSEDQTPDFVKQFLGAVAELNARSKHRPEHLETSGDGLYMVFASVREAAHYALQLRDLVAGIDWAARGLPGSLNIRIALHCGPVYCGRNPLTGSPLYTGPHTSRTARIEPITPPGQVYVSSAFAAVATAIGVEGLAMQYVGRMPLAKGYGFLELYHLVSADAAGSSATDQPAAPNRAANAP